MKLFYYEMKNFGDALNGWLWPRLLPGVFDNDDRSLFVGIGTLLNERMPKQSFKAVFGTGVGYGESTPALDDTWKFYCVRGPLSARALGLEPRFGISDPGCLVQVLDLPRPEPIHAASFIPHWKSAEYWDWKTTCERVGVHYIDPNGETEDVLRQIKQSKVVLAEAMHGAIIADALRVPWTPVKAFKHVLRFKWEDWCQSLGLEYKPVGLPSLYNDTSIVDKMRSSFGSGMADKPATAPLWRALESGVGTAARGANKIIEAQVAGAMKSLAKDPRPLLSSDEANNRVVARLMEKLDEFKADHASGMYAARRPAA